VLLRRDRVALDRLQHLAAASRRSRSRPARAASALTVARRDRGSTPARRGRPRRRAPRAPPLNSTHCAKPVPSRSCTKWSLPFELLWWIQPCSVTVFPTCWPSFSIVVFVVVVMPAGSGGRSEGSRGVEIGVPGVGVSAGGTRSAVRRSRRPESSSTAERRPGLSSARSAGPILIRQVFVGPIFPRRPSSTRT
jgi:hypothetical protein